MRRGAAIRFSALLSAALIGASARAESVDCTRAVALEGDPAATRDLTAELVRLGVAVVHDEVCLAPRLYISPPDNGYRLAIPTRGGQFIVEKAATVQAAAALIAWLLRDSSHVLTSPPRAPESPDAAFDSPIADPRSESTPEPVDPSPPPLPAAPPGTSATRLGFAADLTLSPHDTGLSVLASACHAFGPLCLGGALRGSDAAVSGGITNVARTGFDLLLLLEESFQLGPVLLAPSQGVGAGLSRTYLPHSLSELSLSVACSDGRSCSPSTDLSTVGVRLEVGLSVAVPWGERVALIGRIGLTWAPAAHQDPFLFSTSSTTAPLLPGEAEWLGHAGFGVQFQ